MKPNSHNAPEGVNTFAALVLDEQQHTDYFPLAEEVALSISYNGINYAVMLVTPQNIEDFVVGFSITAGIIEQRRQLYGITLQRHSEHISAEVELSNQAFWKLKSTRRQLAGASGCGLCGIEALDMALPELEPLAPAMLPTREQLNGLRERIAKEQQLAKSSGAVHAALYLDKQGNALACREDIGRHNAFDKLIGAIFSTGLHEADNMVVLTSRCSLELIQKAVRAGLPLLVTFSAPTALAVKWASRYGLTLIHVPKHDAPRVYSAG